MKGLKKKVLGFNKKEISREEKNKEEVKKGNIWKERLIKR